MNRVPSALLLLILLLAACAQGAPPATPTNASTPTASASATSTATPAPGASLTATIILPITSTLPPVTLVLPATIAPTACVPREDWGGSYVIQPGDTLFLIAQTLALEIVELQRANCIENANLIRAGQSLRIPGEPVPAAATPGSPQQAGGTATPLLFGADHSALDAGECTLLRWEIDNVDAVFLDGTQVSGRGIREVCPEITTRYTLLVLYSDGGQEPFIVVVEVRPA